MYDIMYSSVDIGDYIDFCHKLVIRIAADEKSKESNPWRTNQLLSFAETLVDTLIISCSVNSQPLDISAVITAGQVVEDALIAKRVCIPRQPYTEAKMIEHLKFIRSLINNLANLERSVGRNVARRFVKMYQIMYATCDTTCTHLFDNADITLVSELQAIRNIFLTIN